MRGKKIEIVIVSIETARVIELLDEIGVTGYTLIRDVLGKGDRGLRSADDPAGVFMNSYLITVVDETLAARIVENVGPVVHKFGGVLLVSDCDSY